MTKNLILKLLLLTWTVYYGNNYTEKFTCDYVRAFNGALYCEVNNKEVLKIIGNAYAKENK